MPSLSRVGGPSQFDLCAPIAHTYSLPGSRTVVAPNPGGSATSARKSAEVAACVRTRIHFLAKMRQTRKRISISRRITGKRDETRTKSQNLPDQLSYLWTLMKHPCSCTGNSGVLELLKLWSLQGATPPLKDKQVSLCSPFFTGLSLCHRLLRVSSRREKKKFHRKIFNHSVHEEARSALICSTINLCLSQKPCTQWICRLGDSSLATAATHYLGRRKKFLMEVGMCYLSLNQHLVEIGSLSQG